MTELTKPVDDTNAKIRKLVRDTTQHCEYSKDMHEKVEQDVTDVQIMLKTRIQATSQKVPTKLAKLTVPTFHGDYLNWNHFRDIFIQLVHNTTLPGAEKMLHLLNSLSGQAKKLVQHIPISSDNHESAWNIIERRYNNKILLGFKFVNTLLRHPKIEQPTATNIRELHDVTIESIASLTPMRVGVEHWDLMLIALLLNKLDGTTRRMYEESITEPAVIESLQALTTFLQRRFQSLEVEEGDNQYGNFQRIHRQHIARRQISTIVRVEEQCKLCNANGPWAVQSFVA